MSKPSERKRRKQKDRERAYAKQRHLDRERRCYEEKFPTIKFSGEADDGFVRLIRKTIQSIDLRDRSLFHPVETAFYKNVKEAGPAALAPLLAFEESQRGLAALHLTVKLGHVVFEQIPRDELLRWIPFNDVVIQPLGQQIRVHFSSLLRQSSPGGTIYYSRRKPTVVVDGQKKIVGFQRHAIEKVCERYGPRWWSYAGLGDVFAVFDGLSIYEPCILFGNQLAFTFFEVCGDKRFFTSQYVREVLGRQAVGQPYFRVGYCPAVIHGDFISAKTFLFPGYRNTPEYETIMRASLFWNEKRQMFETATTMNLDYLQRTGDFSLIKFFHDNGVPQVIERKEDSNV